MPDIRCMPDIGGMSSIGCMPDVGFMPDVGCMPDMGCKYGVNVWALLGTTGPMARAQWPKGAQVGPPDFTLFFHFFLVPKML